MQTADNKNGKIISMTKVLIFALVALFLFGGGVAAQEIELPDAPDIDPPQIIKLLQKIMEFGQTIFEIVGKIFGAINDWLQAQTGFSIGDILKSLAGAMVGILEALADLIKSILSVF